MTPYEPPAGEVSRLLFEVLQVDRQLAELPRLAEHADPDLLRQILGEASKFVAGVIAPLNRTGDETGARWDAGEVTLPPGAREAYAAFWQAGWPALSTAPEDGGQGLPAVMEMVLYEWLSGANLGWTMAPGLLHGAYECLKHHASPELQRIYLPKVATGEWLATMCLTEPQAGSDLGLVSTRALPQADGSYQLTGTKIFISGGEHDLTENIVHLVLARLPDSPPGPKGLSLFLVPKIHEDGTRNPVVCERIEEKMGLHASPTCVMRFDAANGWLVGDVGKGLNAMFLMMNAARLHVALQGVGVLDAAWHKAQAYALERRQMRAPVRRDPTAAADPIIDHPAVQRLLDTQRVWVDTGRVIAYQTAIELDVAKHHPDPGRRRQAEVWCALVTPVLKAAWTEQGFRGASDCLQVFGGHGYIREWGIEQLVRDIRVAMIYEGTNEIQAQDLLLRKVLADKGLMLCAWLDRLQDDLTSLPSPTGHRARSAVERLRHTLPRLLDAPAADLYPVAGDFLRVVALTLMAWAMHKLAAAPDHESGLHEAFIRWIWPECPMRWEMISAASG